MQKFELDYADMIRHVMTLGSTDGDIKHLIGMFLEVPVFTTFPLIQGRELNAFPVVSELARMIRQKSAPTPTAGRLDLGQGEIWRDQIEKLWANKDIGTGIRMCELYFVRGTINMVWNVKSMDLMQELPSVIVFSAAWLIAVAKDYDMAVGSISYSIGKGYIQKQHMIPAQIYINAVDDAPQYPYVAYTHTPEKGTSCLQFEPNHLQLGNYTHLPKIKGLK
ncbi:MAG: hypothetical protein HRU18_06830 [Pseudoalteromonas sp.]|uniref:thymidylate synthase n=1 Tax=Pseudoalteromonas sp. TaxID=53249 RepID=UPI001D465A6F|nr:thymidylate synthase [Pseudoalteromonas sp.]NRA77905.1 hypothetical protein [Pseudoalteromonas sp.]